MKREFLKDLDLGDGAKLPDAAVEAIMTEYGKSTGTLRETVTALTKERDTLREAATQYADYSELKAQRDALQAEIATRNVRDKVSADTGVPASLLTGDTEETCKAQADAMLSWRGTVPAYPDTHDGGSPGDFSGGSTRDQFAEWFNAAT